MACCRGPSCCLSPCCAAPCVPAVPFCSSPPSPMRVQYVGQPKLCTTLCAQGVDQPTPTDTLRRTRYRALNPYKENMGYPVGVLRSLVASSDKALYFDDNEMNGQRYAMYLKAFAFLHIVPVYDWTRNMLDSLMQEGAELYSLGPEEKKEETGDEPKTALAVPENVYTTKELGIRRNFKLKGYEFEVELGTKYNPAEDTGAAGDLPSVQININSLKAALMAFFKKRKFALLSCFNLYLMIWKADGVYFVLDFYGRKPDLVLSRDQGLATLVCMRGISNVVYLILNKSGVGKRETFSIREMRLAMLVDAEGRAQMRSFDNSRADEYIPVNEDYTYLRAKLHLSVKEKDPLVSRCGLPVAIGAIITSKIDHPASWDTRTLDKIICYGFFICRCCWEFCQNSQTPIDYDSFPNQLQIGQFAVNLTILPRVAEGTWYCVPNFKATDLTFALQKNFESGYNHLVLSINNQTYAIWKKNEFFYFFDPYRHRLPYGDTRSSSLRMFGSFETLLKVLNLVLLQSNTKSTFFIHRVVVTDIRISSGLECLPSVPKSPCPEDLFEIPSINEGICFREDYKRCWDDLGQLSDDEEEDTFDENDIIPDTEEEPKPAGGEEEGEFDGFDQEEEEEKSDDGKALRPRIKKGKAGRLGGKIGRGSRGGKGGGKAGGGAEGGKGEKVRRGRSRDVGTVSDKKKKKGKDRERAGTTDSEKEEAERKKRRTSRRMSRASRASASSRRSRRSKSRESKSRSSKSRRSKSRASKSRASKSRPSKSRLSKASRASKSRDAKPEPKSRESRSRESKSRGSKSRGSRSRGSKSRGSKSRGSKSRGSKSRGSKSRGSKSRGSKSRESKSRESKSRESRSRESRSRDSKSRGSKSRGSRSRGSKSRGSKSRGSRPRVSRSRDGGRGEDSGRGDRGYDDRDRDDRGKYDSGRGESGRGEDDRDRQGDRRDDSRKRGYDDGSLEETGDRRRGDRDRDRGVADGGRYGYDDKRRRGDDDDDFRRDRYGDGRGRKGALRGESSESSTTFSHLQEGYGYDDGGRRKRRDSEDYGVDEDGRRFRKGRAADEDYDDVKEEGTVCRPNAYPGYRCVPYNMAVVGSENGTYESICKLLRAGFKCADRILTMTPYGNFVVFRGCSMFKRTYFVFDGCTCNVDRFRHLDLNCGTAGLLCFSNLHSVITYINDTRNIRKCLKKSRAQIVDEICNRYCKC